MELKAGAAMVDITPELGTHLAGSGLGDYRPAESVLDPLFARAVVLEQDGRRMCVLALDVTMVLEEFTEPVREAASNRWGIAPEACLVHAIQSHSAPSCGPLMLDPDFPYDSPPELEFVTGGEKAYLERALRGALEAIEQACAALEPVEVAVGSGIRGDLAFCRRAVTRDGGIQMPFPSSRERYPVGPTHLRYLEGPMDPEVGVLCLRNQAGRITAMLLHYTCHPVNVFATRATYHAISADWPGAWAREMQETYGPGCTPIILNGCCGNINPWDPYDPEYVPDHRRQGRELAATARTIVEGLTFAPCEKLDWAARIVELPYREIPVERLAEADQILKAQPEPVWRPAGERPGADSRWVLAASTKSVEYCMARMPAFLYEIQALRIGETAFVGLPGEPFTEAQLAIKLEAPAYPTYVAHCTSHYAGYVPTREAFRRGGHEANSECTNWAKLGPEASDLIVENSVDLLKGLFG